MSIARAMMPAMMNGRAVSRIEMLDRAVSKLQLHPSVLQQMSLKIAKMFIVYVDLASPALILQLNLHNLKQNRV